MLIVIVRWLCERERVSGRVGGVRPRGVCCCGMAVVRGTALPGPVLWSAPPVQRAP